MKEERRSGTSGKLNVLSSREYRRLAKRAASMAIAAALAAIALCAPALAVDYNVEDGTVIVENKEDTILSWQDGANAKYAEGNPYNHNESMDNTINITGSITADQVLHVGSGTTGVDENESLDINIGSTDNGVIASVRGDNVIKVEENEGDETKVNISIKNSWLSSMGGSAAIDVDGHTNVDIENSTISGGGAEHAAIEVKGESKVALDNSDVTGSGTGVQVQDNATLIIGGAEIQAGELILTPVNEIPQEPEPQQTTITAEDSDIEMNGGNLVLDANAIENTQEGGDGLGVEIDGDSTVHLSDGTYNDLQFTVNDSMLTVEYEGNVTMQGAGNDAAVTVNVSATEEDSTTGVTFKAAEPGETATATQKDTGETTREEGLTIKGYVNGVRSEGTGNVEINFQEGSNVTIQNSVGDEGQTGDGIYLHNQGVATINIGFSEDEDLSSFSKEGTGTGERTTQDSAQGKVKTKVSLSGNGHAGLFIDNGSGTFNMNVKSSEVHVDENKTWTGFYRESCNEMNVLIKDSYFTASNNAKTGVTASAPNTNFDVYDSYIEFSGNKEGNGITRGNQTYTNSTVVANGNSDCNIKAYTLKLDNTSVTTDSGTEENPNQTIKEQKICLMAAESKDASIPDYSLWMKNSSIRADGDAGESGIQITYGACIEDSSVVVKGSDVAIDFVRDKTHDADNERQIVVDGASVVALGGKVTGDDAKQLFVVKSGSVQVNPDDMEKDEQGLNKAFTLADYLSGKPFNGEKDKNKIYLAPINEDGTMLTQFKLSELVDKGGELTSLGDGIWQLTYCDPNTEKEYKYTFRYNAEGEDLIDEDGGNAYIWVPVSVVKYDPTQGSMGDLGTAQSHDGYAYDMTIYGHSLALAERTMAGDAVAKDGTPDGYTFQGWYVQLENGTVAELEKDPREMTQADWDAFYEKLNQMFGITSRVSEDNITVYAKWGAAPSGGNGGGEETLTPDPEPEDELELVLTPVPTEEEIPEAETPLTDAPVEEIPEEETPLADAPVVDESLEEIGEENVPLADAPTTGDESGVFGLMAALSGMALGALSFIDRKGRHARFGSQH